MGRAELALEPRPAVWDAVSVGSDECPGASKCPKGETCFAEGARRRAAEARMLSTCTVRRMTSRTDANGHRTLFDTPFMTEGWALYWEMLLWDQGFAKTPEDRIGMLFWRMHRSARIIFSLRAHLGTMTPREAIDFLVERVGHERANAEAEVRRSFNGTYPPLYQVAYMLGGLQFRALHAELVQSGKMSNRDFHDAILQGGPMPVELVRARLMGLPLSRDYRASWRFADR